MGGLKSNKEFSLSHKIKTGMSKTDIMEYYAETEEKYAKMVMCLIRLGTLKFNELKPDQKPDEAIWKKLNQ